MDKPISAYNIYCDESSVENPDLPYFSIGALFLPRTKKHQIVKKLQTLKEKHAFHQELKWNKVHARYGKFYTDIIDYFLSEQELNYRIILIEKKYIKLDHYHNNDPELMFYKFYYQLLRNRMKNNSNYYISLDIKTRKNQVHIDRLLNFLRKDISTHNTGTNIKNLQEYNSKYNLLLQLADFMTGLITSANNASYFAYKKNIIEYMENSLGSDLTTGTHSYINKVNIFKWKPSAI